MLKTIIRWGLAAGALLAAGPLAWLATGRLHGPDGGHETTALLSTTPAIGLAFTIGAILLAGLIGLASARLIGVQAGFFNAGLVLAWSAFGAGTIDALARAASGTPIAWRLAAEGLILALPAAGAAWGISAVARRAGLWHVPINDRAEPVFPPAAAAGICAGVAVVVAFFAAWMVAQNTLKGQTIAAGAIAGLFAAATAMALDHQASPGTILASLCAMAFLGPAAGAVMHGGGADGFSAAALSGKLIPAARVLPLDWIAGAFLGTPVGLSLGAWITESRHPKPLGQTATA